MDGRTVWKGTVSAGDLRFVVKLRSAVRSGQVRFHLLHAPDGERLHQQLVCAAEDIPVPLEDQVHGFEIGEGRYVLFEASELKALEERGARDIDVSEFVPKSEIDPIYRDHLYLLERDGLSGGYHELRETLEDKRVAGICSWTMRGRSHIGALEARGGGLTLCTLRHSGEVVEVGALGLKTISVTEKELRIGRELVRQLTVRFKPGRFKDDHREKLMELIMRKANGEKVVLLKPKMLAPTSPDSLLEALEASLKEVS